MIPSRPSRMSWVTRRLAAAVGAAAITVSGCSDPELSATAAVDLQQQVASVRAAADAGDTATGEEALATLRATLEQHAAQGEVTQDRAAEIAAAIELVSERLHLLVPEDPASPPEAPADPQPDPESPADPAPELDPAPGSRGDDEDQGNREDGDERDDDEDDEREGHGPDGRGPPGQRNSD